MNRFKHERQLVRDQQELVANLEKQLKELSWFRFLAKRDLKAKIAIQEEWLGKMAYAVSVSV